MLKELKLLTDFIICLKLKKRINPFNFYKFYSTQMDLTDKEIEENIVKIV